MTLYTASREIVYLADEPIASGGEGEVRAVTSCPSRFTNVCAKLYFKPKQTPEQENKIRFMVANPPKSISGRGMLIAWPLETLYNQAGHFMGFLMPTAFPNSKKLVILTLPKLKESYKSEWYKFDKQLDIKTALISRMKLINNIAIPIHQLHATNKYILKDFKPDNILVTPTGMVTIVDMDSIQICERGRLLFPGTAATPEYMPPEFYNAKVGQSERVPLEKSWDNFAISVVFYQLLFGLNPYAVSPRSNAEDSQTIPYCIAHNLFPFGPNARSIARIPTPHQNFQRIPSTVRDLFIRAFGDNPENRPQAMEWGQTINAELKAIPAPPPPPKPKPTTPKPAPKPKPRPYYPPDPDSSSSSTNSNNSNNSNNSSNSSNSRSSTRERSALIILWLLGLLGYFGYLTVDAAIPFIQHIELFKQVDTESKILWIAKVLIPLEFFIGAIQLLFWKRSGIGRMVFGSLLYTGVIIYFLVKFHASSIPSPIIRDIVTAIAAPIVTYLILQIQENGKSCWEWMD